MNPKRIEEISLNSWPALQQMYYDGWVLRFSKGYTKRANSINILSASEMALETKVMYCEQIYSAQALPAIFRLNSLTGQTLDAILQEQGYQVRDQTSVQAIDLSALACEVGAGIEIWNDRIEDWMLAFAKLQGWGSDGNPIHEKMVKRILSRKFLVIRQDSGIVVSCGLGVLEDGHLGIFDMVTDTAQRNRGFGKQVVSALLALGKHQGASQAYLQVVKKNVPALRLYAGFGFQAIYDYWYRVPLVR